MAHKSGRASDQTVVAASTVIVFRKSAVGDSELLMVKRSKALATAPSAAVFPGGKVSVSDLRIANGDDEQAARVAVIRETIEETGLVLGMDRPVSVEQAIEARKMLAIDEDLAPVLQRFSWTLNTNCLVPFARWLPNFKPGRIFDTRFYIADVGSGAVELSPDHGENTHLFWLSAASALSLIERGELKAIYPTRRNLERIAQFHGFEAVREHALMIEPAIISPWIESDSAQEMLCIPEGLGYPVTVAPLSQIAITD